MPHCLNNAPCPAWLIVAARRGLYLGTRGTGQTGVLSRAGRDKGVMGLVMEHAETIEGYEAVPLALPDHACLQGSGVAVLRRRSARPGRRVVMYVHCPGRSAISCCDLPALRSGSAGRSYCTITLTLGYPVAPLGGGGARAEVWV
jgi:hypothetical protein